MTLIGEGLQALGWRIGQQVQADGPRRPLFDGRGQVVEFTEG